MKLSELHEPTIPRPPIITGEPEPEAVEPQFVLETTPSGIDIYYQWAPKRLYRMGRRASHGVAGLDVGEVPSVTTVLGVLDKSGALTWWGMRVGIEGMLALVDKDPSWLLCGTDAIVAGLTEHKLTVNHVRDSAADRGVNIHGALENWCATGVEPIPDAWYPETERGYVQGLADFLGAIRHKANDRVAEVMVGSLEHLYAGRYDLRLTLTEPVELVTRTYPKKKDKVETVPAGRYLLDLKTSKRVYDTHFLQLEAYEQASVECGYEPTDYRGVLHVTAEGAYELQVNNEWTFEDFAQVRKCYAVMNERAKLKGEREVESVLRDELGAKTVTKDAA